MLDLNVKIGGKNNWFSMATLRNMTVHAFVDGIRSRGMAARAETREWQYSEGDESHTECARLLGSAKTKNEWGELFDLVLGIKFRIELRTPEPEPPRILAEAGEQDGTGTFV